MATKLNNCNYKIYIDYRSVGALLEWFMSYLLVQWNLTLCIYYESENMCGSRVGQGVQTLPPEKSQNSRVSKQIWSRSSEKSLSYQASIQCWAIISTPAKRHLNGVSWRAYSGIWILPPVIKNVVKVGPPLTNFSVSWGHLLSIYRTSGELTFDRPSVQHVQDIGNSFVTFVLIPDDFDFVA